MRIIDDLANDLARSSQQHYDPILHITDGHVWTLGMSLAMWRFVFRRAADEACELGIRF